MPDRRRRDGHLAGSEGPDHRRGPGPPGRGCGADVSRQTISTITDKVLEGMAEWQSHPLDPVYPVVFIDAIHVKIRDGAVANRPIYVALAVTTEGRREILGLWAGDGGEGAKHWLHILTEIKNRGVNDVLMLVCDCEDDRVSHGAAA